MEKSLSFVPPTTSFFLFFLSLSSRFVFLLFPLKSIVRVSDQSNTVGVLFCLSLCVLPKE